ncbi:T9SS type A sorting domain-containing protein [Flavobacterium sp. F372]|uniref:T9SS type A sorting domain-containing protein n=1 Tax=Flavobacterium bernardetii TaxID=2813823 RepID=A0ABR7J283_9FLAO|nr:M12 family metallo-peptidase [Flavobacterium bernardetii]MBC5836135.1 T9SS type A sorting domain-containing protein [Flavobacterium bernardetii]NHF71320.1 T9SS type A sorting domain-containing protein [Flavobacterium bernardetii]
MKKLKIILISTFLIGCNYILQAQEKGKIATKLIEKAAQAKFKVYDNLLTASTNFNFGLIKKEVSKAKIYDFNKAKAEEIIAQSNELISIVINNEITLDLYKEVEAFSSLSIQTSDGNPIDVNALKAVFYRGIIKGNENSLVSISIFENEISGFISNDNGNLVLGKLKSSNEMILYHDKDLYDKPVFNCDMPDSPLDANEIENYQNILPNGLTNNCVRLYFETEFDMFQNLGNTVNVANYVTNLYNQLGTLYANDGISTMLSQIVIWNTVDPYTATTTSALLSQFQSQTSAINGNLGQLLTFRSVGGGIAAGFNGICNSNVDSSLCVSGSLTNTIVQIPAYSWNVMVVSHEFGHLFGSRHTHACVWNGNNTAIDSCADYTEGGCALPGYPSGGGTIMSYCHSKPVGINFNLGFGPQPTAVITNNVNAGACLTTCVPCLNDVLVTLNVASPFTDLIQASQTITAVNTINVGATGIYHATNEVLLKAGFTSVSGSICRAYIEGCSNDFEARQIQKTNLDSASKKNSNNSTIDSYQFKIFPNPTTGKVTIAHNEKTQIVSVFNFLGQKVIEIKPTSAQQTEIDLTSFPSGIYVISNGSYDQKVIKK